MFGSLYAKLGLGLAALILIGLAAFAIKSGIDKIDAQGQQIATLQTALASEKQARERDVAGLTTLAQGMTAAASARGMDEEVLRATIDSQHPSPVSPGLAAFLSGLRARDGASGVSGPAPGAGRPSASARVGSSGSH